MEDGLAIFLENCVSHGIIFFSYGGYIFFTDNIFLSRNPQNSRK